MQLRFTYEPSLMSPGGLTCTRVFFGESEQANKQRDISVIIMFMLVCEVQAVPLLFPSLLTKESGLKWWQPRCLMLRLLFQTCRYGQQYLFYTCIIRETGILINCYRLTSCCPNNQLIDESLPLRCNIIIKYNNQRCFLIRLTHINLGNVYTSRPKTDAFTRFCWKLTAFHLKCSLQGKASSPVLTRKTSSRLTGDIEQQRVGAVRSQ